MKKIDVKFVTQMSMVAALYVALTYAFAPLAYGAIQFRISEILVLLVLYRKEYSIPLIIGCFVANILSPFGFIDAIVGTAATAIVVFTMPLIKNKLVASLIPTIVNAIIIGAMLAIVAEFPFFLTALQITIGQFVVVTLIGLPIFRNLERNEAFKDILGLEEIVETKEGFVAKYNVYAFALCVMLTVFFFILPFRLEIIQGEEMEEKIVYSLWHYFINERMLWLIFILILPIINLGTISVLKRKVNLIFGTLIITTSLVFVTLAAIKIEDISLWIILYYIVFISLLGINIYRLEEKQN